MPAVHIMLKKPKIKTNFKWQFKIPAYIASSRKNNKFGGK